MGDDVIKRFQAAKEKSEAATREADRAQGRLDQIMEGLTREFGCPSLKAAELLLRKKEKELTAKEAELTKLLDAFDTEKLED